MIDSLKIAIYFLLFRYKSIFRNESYFYMHWLCEKPNFQQISEDRTHDVDRIEYVLKICAILQLHMWNFTHIQTSGSINYKWHVIIYFTLIYVYGYTDLRIYMGGNYVGTHTIPWEQQC